MCAGTRVDSLVLTAILAFFPQRYIFFIFYSIFFWVVLPLYRVDDVVQSETSLGKSEKDALRRGGSFHESRAAQARLSCFRGRRRSRVGLVCVRAVPPKPSEPPTQYSCIAKALILWPGAKRREARRRRTLRASRSLFFTFNSLSLETRCLSVRLDQSGKFISLFN